MWLNSIKLRSTGKQLCWKWPFWLCRWPLQGSSCSSFEIIPAFTSSVEPVSSGIFSCPLHSQLPPRPRCWHPLKSRSNVLYDPFLMLLHWWRVPSLHSVQLQRIVVFLFVIVSYWQITTFPSELSLRSSLRVKAAALRSSCEKPASSSSSGGGRALCHRVKKWGQRSHTRTESCLTHTGFFSKPLLPEYAEFNKSEF